MRKNILLLGFVLLVSLFVVSFVSAADPAGQVTGFLGAVTNVVDAIFTGLKPLAAIFFGSENVSGVGDAGSSSFVLANIAIFIIIFTLVYIVLDSVDFFQDHPWSIKLLAVVVSILSVRFLSNGMINAIIFPYKAFGIVVAALVPFALYFIFVEFKIPPTQKFVRKVCWIFFAVVFAALYIIRAYDAPQVIVDGVAQTTSPAELTSYLWIYLATAILALLMILLDGTIQKMRLQWAMDKAGSGTRQDAIDEYTRRINELPAMVTAGTITAGEARRRKRDYQKKLSHIMKL